MQPIRLADVLIIQDQILFCTCKLSKPKNMEKIFYHLSMLLVLPAASFAQSNVSAKDVIEQEYYSQN